MIAIVNSYSPRIPPLLSILLGHKDVMLVKKSPDSKRGFKSNIKQLSSRFFEDNNLDSFKYYQFHLYRNSEFFYARRVILVESKTDAEILKVIAHNAGIDLGLIGCSIINLDGVKNLTYPLTIIKELELPYLIIVDKDFFVPYLNDNNASASKDANGFPQYGSDYKRSSPVDLLLTDDEDKEEIRSNLATNHTKALELLDKYDVISMRYNLETDLLQSSRALELICEELDLDGEDRTPHKILTTKALSKKIKNVELLMNVVRNLNASNYPRSYSRIRRKVMSFRG